MFGDYFAALAFVDLAPFALALLAGFFAVRAFAEPVFPAIAQLLFSRDTLFNSDVGSHKPPRQRFRSPSDRSEDVNRGMNVTSTWKRVPQWPHFVMKS
jgi:hypothetical protein